MGNWLQGISRILFILSAERWAEIDPEIWWEQLGDCMKEIRSQNGVDLKAVAGIGITCSNSLVLLNADQQAVLPAIMQLDQRAVRQAEAMKSEYGQEWVFQKTGNRVSSGAFWGPSLQWVRENRPSLYRQAQFFFWCRPAFLFFV